MKFEYYNAVQPDLKFSGLITEVYTMDGCNIPHYPLEDYCVNGEEIDEKIHLMMKAYHSTWKHALVNLILTGNQFIPNQTIDIEKNIYTAIEKISKIEEIDQVENYCIFSTSDFKHRNLFERSKTFLTPSDYLFGEKLYNAVLIPAGSVIGYINFRNPTTNSKFSTNKVWTYLISDDNGVEIHSESNFSFKINNMSGWIYL